MRYAIVSDLHANRQAWEAVLADAANRDVDAFICLGDVVGYGPMPQWLLNDVRHRCAAVVIGNHDAAACGRLDASIFNEEARAVVEWTRERIDDEGLQFLMGLPAAVEDEGVLYVHAEVEYPERFDYITEAQVAAENLSACQHRLIFFGHTHAPAVYVERPGGVVHECSTANFVAADGCRYLVNVGSVGEPRDPENLNARYVIYDSDSVSVDFCQVDFDKAAYRVDLDREGLPVVPYFLQMYEAAAAGTGTEELMAAPEQRAMRLVPISQVRQAGTTARPTRLIVPLRDGSMQDRPGQKTVNLGPVASQPNGGSGSGSKKGGVGKWIAAVLLLGLAGGMGWWHLHGEKHDQSVDIESKLASESGERVLDSDVPVASAATDLGVGNVASADAPPAQLARPMPAALLCYFPFDKNFASTLGALRLKPSKVGAARLGAGRIGKGVHLNAQSSLRFGDKGDFGIDEDGFSVSAWYQMGGDDGDKRILLGNLPSDRPGGPGWRIVVSRVSAMLMVTDGEETVTVIKTLDLKMPEKQKNGWRHLVAVVDVRRGELRVHLNGGEPAISELKSVAIEKLISRRGLTLGADKRLPSALKFAGKVDDLGIWHRALSPADVNRIREAVTKNKRPLGFLLNAMPPPKPSSPGAKRDSAAGKGAAGKK